MKEQARAVAEANLIAAGQFKEFLGGDGIFYVEDIVGEQRQLQTIFAQVNRGDDWALIAAPTGQQQRQDGFSYLVLEDGYRYQAQANQLDYTMITFAEHRLQLPSLTVGGDAPRDSETLPSSVLWQSSTLENQAELQWRLAMPISVILLTALAIPLSRTSPRQGAKIFSGVLLLLLYNNLLNVARNGVEKGDIPTWLGLWWVHGLLLVLVVVLSRWPDWQRYWHHQSAARQGRDHAAV